VHGVILSRTAGGRALDRETVAYVYEARPIDLIPVEDAQNVVCELDQGLRARPGLRGARSAAVSGLDRGDVDLPHRHHRLERALGGGGDITRDELSHYVTMVEEGALRLTLGPTFPFEALVDAHRFMDANSANGKMVVVL
jgi:NADPH:quinone reductase-like Zn-dependent oxidoreductase